MRRTLKAFLVVLAMVAASGGSAPAQAPAGSWADIYGAPGNYGMAYGTASFGVPRTYSLYSSSYGAGYGYGYAPYSTLPGRYGVGLWRPGFVAPGYVYGSGYYRTFPVPYRPVTGPPVGVYAPAFGPSAFYGW